MSRHELPLSYLVLHHLDLSNIASPIFSLCTCLCRIFPLGFCRRYHIDNVLAFLKKSRLLLQLIYILDSKHLLAITFECWSS